MKVGLFTFPNSISYGASLQMFALYHTVNKLGHSAEIINYYNAYMKAEKHANTRNLPPVKQRVKKLFRKLLHGKLYRKFTAFEKEKMLLYPSKPFTDKQKLVEVGARYGAVICGSDQVWNPDITDTDLSYFLDFCGEKTRRISYAPSFGIDEFSAEFREKIRGELAGFHAISVREAPGQALIKELLGIEAPIVSDPTLLVEKDEWEKLEEDCSSINEEYILYYTIKSSGELFARCREFAEKAGLTMVVVGGSLARNLKNRDPRVRYTVDLSPAQWLRMIHQARYVVTNSFHGTAFSVIYRKDFYLELSSLTNSRLLQIVQALGLEDRIVRKGEAIAPSAIDYSAVEKRLSPLVDSSREYLEKALREEKDNG